MSAIYLKELSSYFKSARGYICLGLYYLFGGQFLMMQIRYQGTNDIAAIFSNMYLVVLLTLPILTMRLMAEEKRTRTDQGLFTAPVTLAEIVWGKFLAAFTVFAAGIAVFILYFIVLGSLSSPDVRMFVGNFLGMLLLGGALISIGLFVSSVTESQMLAAVGTFGCMIFIVFLDSIGGALPSSLSFLQKVLDAVSLEERFSDFTAGLLKPSHILFFVSVTVIFNFLSVRMLDKNRWTSNRKIKNAALSAAVTAVFLAVVVLINVVGTMAAGRLPAIDLTDSHLYRLSEESIDTAKELDTDVTIIVCYDQTSLRDTDYGKQMDELLKEYRRYSSHIEVRFADLVKEPELAVAYADYGVEKGSIIIESSMRTRVSSISDCMDTVANASGTGYTYESKTEQVLTSGILYVSDQAVMQVSVLTGHQESGCEEILEYLRENNYEIKEQNISTEEIDPSSEMAFLFAPMTDYSAEEMEKLDRYLDNGGSFGKRLFYIASYTQPQLPHLESFLAEWGIQIGENLIAETNSANRYDAQGFLFGADFTEDAKAYLEQVKNPALPVLGYYCRPVETLWEEKDNRTAVSLIQSPDTSVLYTLADGSVTGERAGAAAKSDTVQDGDTVGNSEKKAEQRSYGIAALGDRLKYEGTTECHSYVAVFGSTAMFSTSDTVSSNFNNKDFTVALINGLTGKQNGISIAGTSFSAQKLSVTQSSYQMISVLFGILLPLLCFAAGGIMTVHRRRL